MTFMAAMSPVAQTPLPPTVSTAEPMVITAMFLTAWVTTSPPAVWAG
jgi:hypothetical protein